MNRFAWGVAAVCADGGGVRRGAPLARAAVLVDVREDDEWKDGHLKDAKHIALSDLKAGVPDEKLKKTLPAGSIVYLHCGSGKRSLVAADILKKQGYDVRPLKDGFKDLVKNGFPQDK